MYFWNIKALIKSFKDNSITEFEKMLYLLLFIAIALLLNMISKLMPETSYPLFYDRWVLDIIYLIINIFGVLYLYNINSKGDNKDFLARYICIGLPALVRYTVFSIPYLISIIIVLGITHSLASSGTHIEKTFHLILDACGLIWALFLYRYTGKWINEVSSVP